MVEAIERWRRDGLPDRPGAWLQTAACHNALDLVRRPRASGAVAHRAEGEPAARRPLGHRRAAGPAVRVLPPGAGARGPARTDPARRDRPDDAADRPGVPGQRATVAQRIVRAKRKIVRAGIALTVPAAEVLDQRLDDVLTVIA